jgi:hypothetical protein
MAEPLAIPSNETTQNENIAIADETQHHKMQLVLT